MNLEFRDLAGVVVLVTDAPRAATINMDSLPKMIVFVAVVSKIFP
jgi:hypothetical protein